MTIFLNILSYFSISVSAVSALIGALLIRIRHLKRALATSEARFDELHKRSIDDTYAAAARLDALADRARNSADNSQQKTA
ncbi:hypothetical protein ACQP2T_28150 [Nonomuraea sp. CA-143628]|uniref:hypothetical protein n=1 Tax=Nonomuraea sp. CA-143628 TaxID=3239997 RepID=UPI003D9361C3